ncbi:MAG: SDR family oxidoreductase [Polyangiaceae bacterium]|jgi:NAD(P)-dependent dehydrogenase (short-subunit alcohol dehydrogenase family)|nr:SDR family oxidoreductase [Polyangiaceae bacterium]
MVEPSESSTSVPEEHEPASPAYRPPFARGYPRDPALDRLLDAFLEGNHALVFEQAPELARSTHDPAIARAALDLHRRLRPDPLALAMLGGTGALLLLLILWFYAHRHGHLPPPPRRPLRAPPRGSLAFWRKHHPKFLTDRSSTLQYDHSRTMEGLAHREGGPATERRKNMTNWAGKTAVITGGTTGIGLAAAKALLAGGAKVLVTGRNEATLGAARAELGAGAIVVKSDTANLADIDALAERVRGELGQVDFVFVNAGIAVFSPLEQVTEGFYDQLFAVNTRGAFFTVQKLAPLVRQGGSFVLNTSVVDEKGMPGTSVYAATKAALRSMARTLSAELLPRGIRVNAVSPGPITTPIYGKLGLPPEAQAGFQQQMTESNPMKRFGRPEEVARAALFLAFEATYTTGAELPVDGGLTQLLASEGGPSA